jgi:GNAT superfamily N-acetyltransferase
MEWQYEEFTISTDSEKLQLDVIHKYLSEESYWAQGRAFEVTERAIENSLSFGVYQGETQAGFARVVTDRATFAWVADVFILPEYRGKSLSKRLMEAILSHPELQGLRRWVLATKDAHGLYVQFEFTPMKFPERWMERAAKWAY